MWHQVPQPQETLDMWAQMGEPAPRAYQHSNGLTALVGHEPTGPDGRKRWHVSIRYGDPGHNGRVPLWDELVTAAHELRPGVPFVLGIPPRSWWMNVHPHVLHIWETFDQDLIEQWREERQGDAPT
jgi:hypothetical protein